MLHCRCEMTKNKSDTVTVSPPPKCAIWCNTQVVVLSTVKHKLQTAD